MSDASDVIDLTNDDDDYLSSPAPLTSHHVPIHPAGAYATPLLSEMAG
jgi:hypothetical protein